MRIPQVDGATCGAGDDLAAVRAEGDNYISVSTLHAPADMVLGIAQQVPRTSQRFVDLTAADQRGRRLEGLHCAGGIEPLEVHKAQEVPWSPVIWTPDCEFIQFADQFCVRHDTISPAEQTPIKDGFRVLGVVFHCPL
jgi:hypothetical protein